MEYLFLNLRKYFKIKFKIQKQVEVVQSFKNLIFFRYPLLSDAIEYGNLVSANYSKISHIITNNNQIPLIYHCI